MLKEKVNEEIDRIFNNPALKKEYIAVIPLVDKPIRIHITPRELNIPSVKAGLSLVR